jgi:hypothetical protein
VERSTTAVQRHEVNVIFTISNVQMATAIKSTVGIIVNQKRKENKTEILGEKPFEKIQTRFIYPPLQ